MEQVAKDGDQCECRQHRGEPPRHERDDAPLRSAVLRRKPEPKGKAVAAPGVDLLDVDQVDAAVARSVAVGPAWRALAPADRARLLRDVSGVLADHHVNIVSCNTVTGSDRISKMRFDFELGDPSHLDSVIAGIKQIDGVYDAYRVVPS